MKNNYLKVGMAVFCCFFIVFSKCKADTQPKTLKDIIKIDWQELKNCNNTEDCTKIPSIIGCCEEDSINKKYNDLIDKNRKLLWKTLTTPKKQRFCSVVECVPPRIIAVCIKNQCKMIKEK